MQDVNNRGNRTSMRVRGMWGLSVPSPLYFYEQPYLTLKNKAY